MNILKKKVPIKKGNLLIFLFQLILAVGSIAYYFTGYDVWLTVFIKTPATPFIIAFALAAAILVILGHWKFLPSTLLAWCTFFILISIILSSSESWISKDGVTAELPLRLISVTVILTGMVIFTRYQTVQIWVRRTIFLAVIYAICNNLYELVNPEIFINQTVDPDLLDIANLSGRPAGIYLDPNRAGGALILGMIFSVGIITANFRLIYALIIGFVVFITFSRGAILAWLVVFAILLFQGSFKIRLTKNFVIGFIISLFLLLFIGLNNLSSVELHSNNQERLETFFGGSAGDDSGRGGLAELALNKFIASPLIGYGTGADIGASGNLSGKGAHNGYLKYMVENGIFGGLFLPTLVLAAAWKAKGQAKDVALPFMAFMLIWGFFSHNILEERHILLSVALMAAMKKMEFIKMEHK
jgi:hypothetical protein